MNQSPLQEYLFQAESITAHMPLKAGARTARKGLPVKLPEAARVLPAGGAGHVLTFNLLSTVKHYMVRDTCKLRYTRATQRNELQLLLMIDTTASMAADRQISLVKGLVTDMMEKYGRRKPKVSIIALLHGRAETIVPFTNDMQAVSAALAGLRTGGKTNLKAGFEQVLQVVGKQQLLHGQQLYLFTDGRVNAGDSPNPLEEAVNFFKKHLHRLARHTCIINTESGYPRLGMAVILAEKLGCRVFEPEF